MSYVGSPAAAGAGVRGTPQHLFTYGNVGPVTAIIDCVVIIAASVAAGVAYHMAAQGDIGDLAAFAGVGSHTALLFILLARSRGMYRPTALLWTPQWRRIVACWAAVLLAMVAFLFLLKVGARFSRGAIIGFGALAPCLLILSRAAIASRLRSALARGRLVARRAVVIGERDELDHRSAVDFLRKYAIREVGRFELPQVRGDDRKLLTDSVAVLDAVLDAARSGQADVVLLAMRWTNKDRYELVRERLRALPLPVVLLPDQSVRSILAQPMAEMGPDVAVQVQRAPLGALELKLKRAFDVTLAGTALAILSPLLLIVSLAIKLTSRGPVIFRQDRRGFNGRQFKIYKFRTMTVMENGHTIAQAQPNDPRVTALGAFLRASSIDELPQLLNVLRGEMSLVGPRPHAVAHDDEYSRRIANYAYRQHVKPGITGWAQVNGARGQTGRIELMERRVDLDLWYVSNWSIWLDVRILARTCLKVIKDSNAV
jgi:undecaprenyl-phosphate galactose phosphotransferase/putative colanic acid biosynthesis UDP-glucose lipid carrier transferase